MDEIVHFQYIVQFEQNSLIEMDFITLEMRYIIERWGSIKYLFVKEFQNDENCMREKDEENLNWSQTHFNRQCLPVRYLFSVRWKQKNTGKTTPNKWNVQTLVGCSNNCTEIAAIFFAFSVLKPSVNQYYWFESPLNQLCIVITLPPCPTIKYISTMEAIIINVIQS